MKKPNRKCVICGTEYYYCNHGCTDSLNKPAWMTSFCCENCKNAYDAAARYNMKKISAEEARVILDTCDLSNKDNFATFTKNLINEIYDITTPLTIVEVANLEETCAAECDAELKIDEQISVEPTVSEVKIVEVSEEVALIIEDAIEVDAVVECVAEKPQVQSNVQQITYKKKKKKKKND